MKKSLGPKPIAYPAPVFVIGTYDFEDKPNIMTVAWAGICCSRPPCMAVSIREATYSYGNINRTKAFTVNIPSSSQVKEADYAGTVSGKNIDKFEAAGLTPVRSEIVNAPYVGEFPLVLECECTHSLIVGLHTLFVGEIKDVKADESILDQGKIDLAKLSPLVFAPELRQYFEVGRFVGKAFSIGKSL